MSDEPQQEQQVPEGWIIGATSAGTWYVLYHAHSGNGLRVFGFTTEEAAGGWLLEYLHGHQRAAMEDARQYRLAREAQEREYKRLEWLSLAQLPVGDKKGH